MSLKKQIEEKLNEALKTKDKNTYPTLRLVVSAIKDAEIASRAKGQKEMSDSDIMTILKKMIKQRNESCEVYEKAGRKELLENEKKEIAVISIFLPKPSGTRLNVLPTHLASVSLRFQACLAFHLVERQKVLDRLVYLSFP